MKNVELRMKNLVSKKMLAVVAFMLTIITTATADDRQGHIQIGTGLLYERGWDLTVGYEYETNYHHAWEFFGNVYLKWDECAECGHVCPESFGATIIHGAWVLPTSHACFVVGTTTATCVWAGRWVRTGTGCWAASMWAMSTAMRCARAGSCFGRPNAT